MATPVSAIEVRVPEAERASDLRGPWSKRSTAANLRVRD